MMRKILIIGFVAVLSLVLANGFADAKISGVCSNCHTMHNSQNGTPVAAGGPYEYLLIGGATAETACWGCHAQDPAAGALNVITAIPQVAHNTTDLAGGNFSYIVGGGAKTPITGSTETVGHNIKDTSVTDDNFSGGTYPPGDQHSNTMTNATFTCAGVNGCHGDRTKTTEYLAIVGAHHYVDNALKFGTINEANQALSTGTVGIDVGSSYRFLKGVKGGEETLWSNTDSDTHNEYKGASSMGVSSATAPVNATISGLCAECHGYFHGTATDETGGSLTPWKRHPTDIVLNRAAGTEYSAYQRRTLAALEYSVEAPIARQTIPNAIGSAVSPANEICMCLSCHGGHATAYEDILRWNYSGMDAGTTGTTAGTGCFVCHTQKDDYAP